MKNVFEVIVKDLVNNDHRSFETYLEKKFGTANRIDGDYIGKKSCDMEFRHILNGRYSILERLIQVLESSAKLAFGKDVEYIPFIMEELLPDRFGVELWAYKKENNMNEVNVGDLVEFKGKDSYFKGVIVTIFTKLDGVSVRCCVQDDRGLLLIKNPRDAVRV